MFCTAAPLDKDDKNGQWLGVSVSSQAKPDGKALVSTTNKKKMCIFNNYNNGEKKVRLYM